MSDRSFDQVFVKTRSQLPIDVVNPGTNFGHGGAAGRVADLGHCLPMPNGAIRSKA